MLFTFLGAGILMLNAVSLPSFMLIKVYYWLCQVGWSGAGSQ